MWLYTHAFAAAPNYAGPRKDREQASAALSQLLAAVRAVQRRHEPRPTGSGDDEQYGVLVEVGASPPGQCSAQGLNISRAGSRSGAAAPGCAAGEWHTQVS